MNLDFLGIAALGSATLIFGFGSIALLLAWLPTLRWQCIEAHIETLKVFPKAGKYVRMNPHVIAKYNYTYNGTRYEGRRISVFEVRPRLFNGYDPNALRRLDEAIILEELVPIKIDPRHPSRSILLNPPVWGHLAFGFVGAVICGLILALIIHLDTSSLSVAVGWGLALLGFIVSIIFRDGVQVLIIFNGI